MLLLEFAAPPRRRWRLLRQKDVEEGSETQTKAWPRHGEVWGGEVREVREDIAERGLNAC